MDSVTLSTVVFTIFVWIITILLRALRSPLSKIPNAHFSAPYSRIWLFCKRYKGSEVTTCHEAHRKLGPLIRIGPNEVSLNCIEDGVQIAFATNWDKAELYANFVNYGHPPLFSILKGKPHAERKRLYSQVYSKSTIDNSVQLKRILGSMNQILDQKLRILAENKQTINVLPLSEAYSMDTVTAYLYGSLNGTHWLNNEKEAMIYLPAFQTILEPQVFFLFTEIPNVLHLAERIGINLIPKGVLSALGLILPYVHDLTKHAIEALELEKTGPQEDRPALALIQNKIVESTIPEAQRLDIRASDTLDQIHAAHEATGIVLTFVMLELTRTPKVQSALREELQLLSRTGQSPLQSTLLEDIILETSRLYPAAFGPFPRSAPPGARIAGFNIPAGTTVTASPFILGRNAEIFPDPERWDPYRWSAASKDHRKTMKKWVWMFTIGSRMCIGEHLAILTIKSFVAEIYRNYRTILAKKSNMKQLETFIALPTDASLFLRFEAI